MGRKAAEDPKVHVNSYIPFSQVEVLGGVKTVQKMISTFIAEEAAKRKQSLEKGPLIITDLN